MAPSLRHRLRSLRCSTLERMESFDLLYGEPAPTNRLYCPQVHPAALLRYFRRPVFDLPEIERMENRHGEVRWVRRQAAPPTFKGAALQLGVPERTLRAWASTYPEFKYAVELCRAVQEHFVVAMGATSALDSRFASFAAVNLLGWTHRVRRTDRPAVQLLFGA